MRIIKKPKEWKVQCPKCTSILAYTILDILWDKFEQVHFVRCPSCQEGVDVPSEVELRDPVEEISND